VGLDFIRVKGKAFVKQWDAGRDELTAPDLLEAEAEWQEQHVLFEIHHGFAVAVGEELVVQVDGDNLVALRAHDMVATATAPPANVLAAIREAHGYVLALVARYSPVSRTADLVFRLR